MFLSCVTLYHKQYLLVKVWLLIACKRPLYQTLSRILQLPVCSDDISCTQQQRHPFRCICIAPSPDANPNPNPPCQVYVGCALCSDYQHQSLIWFAVSNYTKTHCGIT